MVQWLTKKRIAEIFEYQNEFLFVTHKDFGKNYEIRSSISEQLRIKAPEQISPNSNFRILDMCQSLDIDEDNIYGSRIILLTSRDSNFNYHECLPRNGRGEHNRSLSMKNVCSRSAMWPYVCLSDAYNQIWVYCGYDHTVVKRIVLPYSMKNSRVEQVFVTNEFDLFVLINHFRSKSYELLQIDLDRPRGFIKFEEQTFTLMSLFRYTYEDVGGKPCLDMVMRSQSKDSTSINKKLFAFILHKNHLYHWVQGNNTLKHVSKTLSVKLQ
jgi:hypothetical protein